MSVTAMTVSMDNVQNEVLEIAKRAKDAAYEIAAANSDVKNRALLEAAKSIRSRMSDIQAANDIDVSLAKDNGITGSFLDRLVLNEARIEAMAKGLEDIAALEDPVGRELASWSRKENGLNIKRVAVPLGVIGVIYESRPNVTADAGALCLKAGNCAILRGGSESLNSSKAIMESLHKGLKEAGLCQDIIQLIPTKDRQAVGHMLQLSDYIDVIIPRGGKSLIQRIIDESKIPTFQHLDGNCHSYVHGDADIQKAVSVIVNAKMRRTGICGATESVVVDRSIADRLVPELVDVLDKKNCEVRGGQDVQAIDSRVKKASEEDYDTEYLDAILSVKIVENIDQAISFINQHGSHHTDAIMTEDNAAAEKFLNGVDSAIVMLNTSTQFADGGEFGMGAEIGIATGKLHARGPVGIEQLCTFKYQVRSDGATRV